jgi:hypothetical protein
MLRQADFVVVTHYDEYGDEGHKIADPAIIKDCGLKNRVLLTGDQDLVYTWAVEIREAGIAVFVTTDNNEGPDKWGPRIVAAKRDIWRELARRAKPFTARISREGQVTQVRVFERGLWKAITVSKKKSSQRRNKD